MRSIPENLKRYQKLTKVQKRAYKVLKKSGKTVSETFLTIQYVSKLWEVMNHECPIESLS
jgi:hypothetical protein